MTETTKTETSIVHQRWEELVPKHEHPERKDGTWWDALVTDPPYSVLTHAGHDRGVTDTADGAKRETITYPPWGPDDVHAFVEAMSPRVRGWMCVLTDSELMPHWRAAYRAAGRLDFHPVPCCISGMTVRVRGDGPSSEAVYLMLARPRTAVFSEWGTTRGFYVCERERQWSVGGKPLDLMKKIVRDYTLPGDLVLDPCCGGGTTGAACVLLGRSCVLADSDFHQVETTRRRLSGGRRALQQCDVPEGGLFAQAYREPETTDDER